MSGITPYHAKYFAHFLTRRLPANNLDKLTASLHDAQVDLTPHQIDAALFAFKSPLSNGAILADEVGLGKTIEAGIILSQHWAEHKRRLLIICPANLRKQWSAELMEKFFIPSYILEAKSFNQEIGLGNLNPFNKDGIVICSYQFARAKAAYLRNTSWDLVVIDEAHRLRNVYKPNNRIANTIKEALLKRKKILLTATPLQNSILELYGLVSIIDDFVFGDLKSFKSQFSKILTENDYRLLRNRLQPVCKRTLRRQVLEYIKYTKRIAICEEYYPTDNEQKLYELVSAYLQRPLLYALPNSQRQLMTMILRKLLASSTYAIYGTLTRLIERLEDILRQQNAVTEYDTTTLDFDGLDDNLDYWVAEEESIMAADSGPEEILHPHEIEGIKNELTDLREFQALAAKIRKNSKAEHLFVALNKGFEELEKLGANKKALLFTESRRTQDFLFELFEKNGYKGKVVLFNGSNSDKQSTAIYKAWLEKHKGSSKITGSATADKRAALVEYFRDHATIMIATEAAAEGLNLQFCSLVINYDLPWNPQRIEQRIGRCHRYGQKYDVVVVNFLNTRNYADVRVFDLLSTKFKLFDDVFGASDEVLGQADNIDIESRIWQIYQQCRSEEEINSAFEQLQNEMQEQIDERMSQVRSQVLENFDINVQEHLRMTHDATGAFLNRYEHVFWELTKFMLSKEAVFNDEQHTFVLRVPVAGQRKGKYAMLKNDGDAIPYRFNTPLAQYVINSALSISLDDNAEIEFDQQAIQMNAPLPEYLLGAHGVMVLARLGVSALADEQYLLFNAMTDDGKPVSQDDCEKLFLNGGKEIEGNASERFISDDIRQHLQKDVAQHSTAKLKEIDTRNLSFFKVEENRIYQWEHDIIDGIEAEIGVVKRTILETERAARNAESMAEKLELEKKVDELKRKKRRLRNELEDREDEVGEQRKKMIRELEQRMIKETETQNLFIIRWTAK